MIARLMRVNFLEKNKNKHRQIAAESLENDTNHETNKISKLKLYQSAEGQELVELTETWKKPRLKPKEEVNFSLKMVN